MENKMKILNLGSLNLDKVYTVEQFVRPGQTIMASDYEVYCGGKGLNQSLAAARAGAPVLHAGMIGADGECLRRLLEDSSADTGFLRCTDCESGHAIIQVEPTGQNCIIVYGGANQCITDTYIDEVLRNFSSGDYFLTQNETSGTAYAILAAHQKGLRVFFNPSPITPEIRRYPLELVDVFLLNEIEGAELSECHGSYQEILEGLHRRFPKAAFVLTVGSDGAYFQKNTDLLFQPAFHTDAVDTTGAGDTFTGYFLASLAKNCTPGEALFYASRAAAVAVGRSGAAPSIPTWDEMIAFCPAQ